MQVTRKEKQLKEVDVTLENYTVCDKCNNKVSPKWGDAFEFDFELRSGFSYPEGGNGDKYEMDLCEECALELITLLQTSGYRINKSTWDW